MSAFDGKDVNSLVFRTAATTDVPAIGALIRLLGKSFVINPNGSGAEAFWRP